jgi:dihydropteroate synthase
MLCEGKITTFFKKPSIICQKKILSFDNPKVMGILNITEDSFFDGGKHSNLTQAISKAQSLIEEGVDIIDIGACSTRPGAKLVEAKEEIEKIIPLLKTLKKEFPETIISIDTVWSEVSKAVVDNGADIINDISGGNFDKNMLKTIGELNVPYILTHCKETPDKMQNNPNYNNHIIELSQYFSKRIDALYNYGAKDIILDLGFGFGKNLEDNYLLLARQNEFKIFNLPILTGISRKSMIYKPLDTTAQQALNGTTFLHAFALQNGADILRVHDVKEAKECIKLYNLYKKHIKQ